jgi:phosphodiesterase/alkaline phosphatase D-like protein
MRLALTGDGIASDTAITTSNTGRRSGNKLDVVTLGTGASLTADSSLGAPSVRVRTPGSVNAYGRYQFAPRTQSTMATKYVSIWAYFLTNPSASTSIFFVGNATAQRCLELRVISSGLVQAYDASGTARAATTTAIATNQWVRIDLEYVTHASAGTMQIRLYNDPNSEIPTSTSPLATGLNLRQADANELFFGTVNSSAAVLDYRLRAYWSDRGPAPFGTGWVLSGWVGNTTQTSATIVARTVMASSVRLAVSTSSDLSSPVYSSAVTPDADGVARLDISGLTADSQYYFGFEVDGQLDEEMNGAFQTFPAAGPVSFSFAAGSCAANWSNSGAFMAIRNYVGPNGRGPLFFQHLGDLHYLNPNTPDTAVWHNAFDQSMTTPQTSAFFRNLSVPYTWSDHDSSHSNTDGNGPGLPGAQAVYRSRVPHYPLASSDVEGIYYSFAVGDEVLCIVTDGRSYMSPIADPDNAAKTKLGAVQKQWLKDQLSSDHLVKIWFHEDAWNNGSGTYVGDDTWTAYTTERQEIADFIVANEINVAYVCGDLHVLAADDGTNSAGGIPVYVCSPLDQTAYVGNGTYSAGHYPLEDSVEPNRFQQFGMFDVEWTGTSLTLTYKGMDASGATRVTQTRTWLAPEEPGSSPFTMWTGTSEVPLVVEGVWDGSTVQPVTFDQIV